MNVNWRKAQERFLFPFVKRHVKAPGDEKGNGKRQVGDGMEMLV